MWKEATASIDQTASHSILLAGDEILVMELERAAKKDAAAWSQGEAAEAAESDSDNSRDQTGFLLQRLDDLKRWQREQEMKLLRDQKRQMEALKRNKEHDAGKKNLKSVTKKKFVKNYFSWQARARTTTPRWTRTCPA